MDVERMQSWPAIVATVAVATILYGFVTLVQHRRFYRDLPKPPYSFLWGHLKLMGEVVALFPSGVHIQVIVTTLTRKYNLPGIWYLDLWPIGPTFCIVTDPDVALHMTAIKNHPKHPAEAMFVDPVIGKHNIVTVDGPRWKHLHNMLAPAFAISQVRNMLPMIAEDVMTFRSILHQFAESGEVFKLEKASNNLTFDIMGKAIFSLELKAQTDNGNALQVFEEICRAFAVERETWNPFKAFFAKRRRLMAISRMDPILERMIRERFEVLQRDNVDVSQKRGLSIMDLVLRERLEEVRKSGENASKALDREFMDVALTQIKALLLAGSGTTTDTLCFAYMLLSINPKVVQKMREEHDRVFTTGIDATYALLQENPNMINELEYTTNVVKETLRFYPIGNTARAEDATGFLTYNGVQYPTKGQMICPVQHTMHYNPDIFPNPGVFDPDRFARDEAPRHAWRPFERGPRACLGQSLAMDELKVILLLTVREFDFECADLKPNEKPRVPWTDLDLTFGDRAFQEFVFEARPRDGMPMRVKSRKAS